MADQLPPCLSVRQPWAFALVYGGKDIENRTRRTSYRGRFLIHASAGMAELEYYRACHFMKQRGVLGDWSGGEDSAIDQIARGGIIGVADIIDCVDSSDSPWWIGPRGFVVANARPLPFIACKGTVTPLFWRVPPELREQVKSALLSIPT